MDNNEDFLGAFLRYWDFFVRFGTGKLLGKYMLYWLTVIIE